MNNKTILVTGARGQLGKTLEHCWSASGLAADNELVLYDIEELDLPSSAEVQKQLNSINPHAIVNTAASLNGEGKKAEARSPSVERTSLIKGHNRRQENVHVMFPQGYPLPPRFKCL